MLDRSAFRDLCVSWYCGWVCGKPTCCALTSYIQWFSITAGKYVSVGRAWFMNDGAPAYLSWTLCSVILILTNGYVQQDFCMAPTIGQINSFMETFKNGSVFSSTRTGRDTAQSHFWWMSNQTPPPQNLWKGVTTHDQMCSCALIQVEDIWSSCVNWVW